MAKNGLNGRMRESSSDKANRTARLIERLNRAYPGARCELNFSNPLELLMATILSARCTDKQVNIVTAKLFHKYRQAGDYAQADLAELEQDLKSLGLYRNKARNIRDCARFLLERHGGSVPRTHQELMQLAGVGRKTANVVLGNAFHFNLGIAVDTHVTRVSQRLGLSRQKLPDKIESDLQERVPQGQWTMFSHWLIWHGRRRCRARKPDCLHCEILDLCPSASSFFERPPGP
jgi:endonuclease III